MLSWFIDQHTIKKVLHDNNPPLIEENEMETRPERVPMKCLNENVSLIWHEAVLFFRCLKSNRKCCESFKRKRHLERFHLQNCSKLFK